MICGVWQLVRTEGLRRISKTTSVSFGHLGYPVGSVRGSSGLPFSLLSHRTAQPRALPRAFRDAPCGLRSINLLAIAHPFFHANCQIVNISVGILKSW